jgi:hypothetical protein
MNGNSNDLIAVTLPKKNFIVSILEDYKLGYPYAITTVRATVVGAVGLALFLLMKK